MTSQTTANFTGCSTAVQSKDKDIAVLQGFYDGSPGVKIPLIRANRRERV